MYEHKEGNGSIFKQSNKPSENSPEYRGTIMINGDVYELAGWVKQGNTGAFLSLRAKLKGGTTEVREGEKKKQEKPSEDADALPF